LNCEITDGHYFFRIAVSDWTLVLRKDWAWQCDVCRKIFLPDGRGNRARENIAEYFGENDSVDEEIKSTAVKDRPLAGL
jgi:hypothetical protein